MSAYCSVDTSSGSVLVKVVLHETATTGEFVPDGFNSSNYTFSSSDTSSSPTSGLSNVIAWVNANDISDDLIVKLDKRNSSWIGNHEYPTQEELNYMFLAEDEYTYNGLNIQKGYVYQVGQKYVSGSYYDWYNGYNHIYTTVNTLADGIAAIYATGWQETLVEDSENPGDFYLAGHVGDFLYKYTSSNYWSTADSVNLQVWTSVTYDELASRVEKISAFGSPINKDLGRVAIYTGETTTSAPIYIHGHFYECKLVNNSPAWVDLSSYLDSASVMPNVIENKGKTIAYIGETTSKYEKGQVYNATTKAVDLEAEFNGVPAYGDTNSTWILAAQANAGDPAVGASVFVAVIEDGDIAYYYKDALVESTTDNRLYPSTKVDDNDYLVAEYAGGAEYSSIQVLDWYPAVDLSGILKALDERISIVNALPSEPATITDYNKGKSFYVINDGTYPSTVKGHQLYHADYKLVTAPSTLKYDYWTSGEYYEYMFESDKTIEAGDTVYLVNSNDEIKQLSRDVVVEVDDEYLAPSSMLGNSDGYIYKGSSPSEVSELGEVYMLDWVPMYDINNKQDKLLFDKAFLPNADKLVDNPVIVKQTGHTVIGVAQSFGKAIDLYAIDTARSGQNVTVYTDKLPITKDNAWYDYIEADDYYAQNPDFVNAGRYYSGNGWATYTRNTSKDTTATSIYKYLDIDDKNIEKLSDLTISDRKIDDYIKNSPYIVSNKESDLFGKTVALQSVTETGTWYEWSASTNKIYTKTPTIEVGTECWFTGNTDFNKSGLLIKDVLVESYYSHSNPTLEPSTEYGRSNSWEIDTTSTPVEKSDYTIAYGEWVDTNANNSGILTEDIEFNVKVGGWDVGDIAYAGMTQQAFNERLAHEYKEPTLAFTSTASTYLLNKDNGVVAQPFTLTATATKQDLDIVETWIENAEGTKLATGTTTASYVVESNVYDDVTYKAFTKDAKKTIAPKTISYEFIYGFFKGTSAAIPEASADVKALTLDLTKKAKKEYTFTASNQYLTVAYPASYGNLTKITDQNGFANLDAWNKTVVAVSMNVWDDTEGDYVATDVNYNVYTTNDKITCSNFKYTFEF